MRSKWCLLSLTIFLVLGCTQEDRQTVQHQPLETPGSRETLSDDEAEEALSFTFREFVVPDEDRGRSARFQVTNRSGRVVVGAVMPVETLDAQGSIVGTCPWTVSTTSGWLDRGAQQEALLGFELEAESVSAGASAFEVTVAGARETIP